jgi:hypothetical protein
MVWGFENNLADIMYACVVSRITHLEHAAIESSEDDEKALNIIPTMVSSVFQYRALHTHTAR